jgi:putative tryptophan/tyrosine transport system substrate-binding protein
VKRRDFITLLGGAAAVWPLTVRAQQGERMRRIGVLTVNAENDQEYRASIAQFVQVLASLGWTEGRNIQIDHRYAAGDVGRTHAFAKELVGLAPDVLFTSSTPTSAALWRETKSIPIVFAQVSDPIGEGFVASLARPGGHMTGLTNFEPSLGGKWLEILREIAPAVSRVALLFNPQTSPGGGSYYSRPIEAAAAALGMQPITMPVHAADDVEPAVKSFARDPNGGLLVLSDVFSVVNRKVIIGSAAQHRLPAIYFFQFFVTDGGLVSYGVDRNESFRRAAAYVDRILRGAKPSDLPVEAPTKFELVINVKTAKALGLEVPPSLLARADEVIE